MKRNIVLLFFITFFCALPSLNAQYKLESQLDLGDNILFNRLYLHLSGFGYYEREHWGAGSGAQLGLVQPHHMFFNSWYGNAYGKIFMGKVRLDLGGEYLWTAFSNDLREINWIIFTRSSIGHWQFALGNNTRIYRFGKKALNNDQDAEPESSIIEGWNLMYSVGLMLKPVENRWNIMFTLTDFDRFLIQQETNPMANVRFNYKISTPLMVYSELWYKSSGFFNIQVNYFGTFIRIGALWEL
jgi:hypothetical protein